MAKGSSMSKRKNRNSSPNLPESALERARQQIAEERSTTSEEPSSTPNVEVGFVPAPKPAPARTRTNRRPGAQPIQARGGRKEDLLDPEYVRNRLENPTRTVSEAELRAEYGYVTNDLRTMGLLAAVLIAALIIVGQFIR